MAYAHSENHQGIFQYSYPLQNFGHYVSDGSIGTGDESNFWTTSPRSESPSPNEYLQAPLSGGGYQIYKPLSYTSLDQRHAESYKEEYINIESSSGTGVPFVRVFKRRTTANKKERRRTQSINNAYADLRDCIPKIPSGTKLSKIKTLRLATLYISYLTNALEGNDPAGDFKAELGPIGRKTNHSSSSISDCAIKQTSPKIEDLNEECKGRKTKGRTGWPQHVWALELKQEQI